MNINFTDRYNREEGFQKSFWSVNKKIGALLLIILAVVILFNTTGCTKNEDEDLIESPQVNEELPKDTVKYGDDGVNASIAPDDDPSVVSMQKGQLPEDTTTMVAMSVEDSGRLDPFLPAYERATKVDNTALINRSLENELLPPPQSITVDDTAKEVMTTKVSGIMYDNYNPSAIINIDSADYLVRSGDYINGYKVLSIAKNYVTVQHGANIYKAGVGEIFTDEGINFNEISNLEGKFGGRKNTAGR